MLGIFKGMKVTIEHAFKKKVTQLYPYVKPELPERSRGLIQLIREPETGVLKCEACLLCEKACPPRAITISHRPRNGFRRRPLFRPKTQSAFYRPRMSTPAPYQGRPPSSVFDLPAPVAPTDVGADRRVRPGTDDPVRPEGDGPIRPSQATADDVGASRYVLHARVEQILDTLPPDADLMEVIETVQGELGYLPIEAARIISRRREVAMSDLLSMATQNPSLRLTPRAIEKGGADGG